MNKNGIIYSQEGRERVTDSFQLSVFIRHEPIVVSKNVHVDRAAANTGGFGFRTVPTCR
jgi:hypothetical protein